MRRLRILIAAAALLVAACGSGGGGGGGQGTVKAITIAAAGPFTGDLAPVGQGGLHGVQMAVDDWNAKGGIDGVKVQVETADDTGKPDQGVTLASKLASEDAVLGVIGPMNSSVVLATAPIFQRVSLPFITESGSNPMITESGWSVAHRLCARDDTQGPADARYATSTLGAKRIFVLDSKTAYSQGLADQFEQAAKSAGTTTQRDSLTSGTKDANPIATKIKAFKPDLLFFADEGPEAPLVLQGLKSQGLSVGSGFAYMGTDGQFDVKQFIQGAQGASEGAYVSNIAPDINSLPASSKSFVQRYTARYPDLGPFDATAYEAASVLLTAIKDAPVRNGKIDRADVNRQLGSLTYNGILGIPVHFDSKGDVQGVGIFLFQVKSGQFSQVKAPGA
ncbi:MAG TPA: branched-chain amino acid ABC transporter substrate-binding protein [Candidatus Dormibacteraeota bacterium]|nr:branched-chain amino acid ABC transporter substrate-binding protein [Candidatus Dormibacteraeota bacterium]